MQKKVFISFVEEDLKIAKVIKNRLQEEGLSTWIYTEDNIVGDYRTGIIQAIADSEVMILIFSKHTENSLHIPKELREAAERNVTIIPFFIEDIKKIENANIRYEIQTLNWLHGWKHPLEEQINILIDKTKKNILGHTSPTKKTPPLSPTPDSRPLPSNSNWFKVILGMILISLAVSGTWYLYDRHYTNPINPNKDKNIFSQNRIEQFLTNYLTVGEGNSPDKFLSYFASLVKPYLSKEQATRKEILEDKINYMRRWPQRKYDLKGFSILEKGADHCVLSFTINWQVQSNTLGAKSGKSSSIITIKQKNDKFYIVSIEEIPTTQNSKSPEMLKNIQKCEKDDARACTTIGKSYADSKQYEEAFPYFKKGCELGSDWGCSWLGWSYFSEKGTNRDYKKAIESYLKIKGELGTSPLNNLAWMYQYGKGTKDNIDLAVQYYQKSADLNNTFAIKELSKLRKKQESEMLKNIQKCEKDDASACGRIGKSYADNKLYEEAFPYFKKSCDLGNDWGCDWLGWSYFRGYGIPKNIEKAFVTYSRVRVKGKLSAASLNNLAWMYQHGKGGTKKNIDLAIQYYQESADMNNTYAIKEVSKLRKKQELYNSL